jgi:hypothetical protein
MKLKLFIFIAIGMLLNSSISAQSFFKDTNGKYGLKDANGKVILPGKYVAPTNFANGYAIVAIENAIGEFYGVIDQNGKEILECKYSEIEIDNFGSTKFELLIKALDFNFVYVSLFDPKTGNEITSPRTYYKIEPFINGRAKVLKNNYVAGKGSIEAFIDETGKEINSK